MGGRDWRPAVNNVERTVEKDDDHDDANQDLSRHGLLESGARNHNEEKFTKQNAKKKME